jgi:ABC-2 type transport system ATP-binding protein
MESTIALSLAGVDRALGRRRVLRAVSAEIPVGRVAALVGRNGAGKTTLLHTVVGLAAPDGGRVLVFGKVPRSALVDGDVGFVAQDRPVYRRMSVRDHLRMGAHLNRRWDMSYALSRLEGLGIGLGRRAGTLSGGERSQLVLTLALARVPRLLVLDEPAAALDPLAREEFLAAVTTEARQRAITVLHSSHDVAGLEATCDFLMVLRDGCLVFAGETAVLPGPGRGLAEFVLEALRGHDARSAAAGAGETR